MRMLKEFQLPRIDPGQWWSLLFLVIALLTMAGGLAAAEMEPDNNVYTGAEAVTVPMDVTDYNISAAEDDWFLVTKDKCSTLSVVLVHSGMTTDAVRILIYPDMPVPPVTPVHSDITGATRSLATKYEGRMMEKLYVRVNALEVNGTIPYDISFRQIPINPPIQVQIKKLRKVRKDLRRKLRMASDRARKRDLKRRIRNVTKAIDIEKKSLCQ